MELLDAVYGLAALFSDLGFGLGVGRGWRLGICIANVHNVRQHLLEILFNIVAKEEIGLLNHFPKFDFSFLIETGRRARHPAYSLPHNVIDRAPPLEQVKHRFLLSGAPLKEGDQSDKDGRHGGDSPLSGLHDADRQPLYGA
jgi:hypothetical protein